VKPWEAVPSYIAEWPGICAVCDEAYSRGSVICATSDGYRHDTCGTVKSKSTALGNPLCEKCFTYHAGECI
jgi:hypothetical protein